MPVEVILPKVDMDMATGQISRWFVAEGATVKQGDLLFEIETDKAAMEIDAPAGGIVRDITGKEGVDIAVGSPVAWIYAAGEAYGGPSKQNEASVSPLAGEMSAQPTEADASPGSVSFHVAPPLPCRASPPQGGRSAAATCAPRRSPAGWHARMALPCPTIAGSGPHGRIVQRRCRGGGQGTRPLACRPSPPQGAEITPASLPAPSSRCRTMRC